MKDTMTRWLPQPEPLQHRRSFAGLAFGLPVSSQISPAPVFRSDLLEQTVHVADPGDALVLDVAGAASRPVRLAAYRVGARRPSQRGRVPLKASETGLVVAPI